MSETPASLIIAASESDSNLYYACRFLAPDPFVFLQIDGRKTLLMSDLEVDRARAQARVDEVLSLSQWEAKARQRWPQPRLTDTVRPSPFLPERVVKAPEEVTAIEETQRHTETALEAALAMLREGVIRGDEVLYRGRPLTSEDLKKAVNVSLMENDCIAEHTIIACGEQGVDPHNQGSGVIRPNQGIIFDIFPRSSRTRYFADMTRTVVKGRASDELRRLYDAVLASQLRGIELIRDGASGSAIHAEVNRTLESRGYTTGVVNGRNQGFFHGTGHGVGLDIHELPRISRLDSELKTGHVVTVEPGLYYPGRGAVRIEDMVLVEGGGCRNLTRSPKMELLEL
jgi:Xaa-Pro aminopeptidase